MPLSFAKSNKKPSILKDFVDLYLTVSALKSEVLVKDSNVALLKIIIFILNYFYAYLAFR